jgi:hypothetical protein
MIKAKMRTVVTEDILIQLTANIQIATPPAPSKSIQTTTTHTYAFASSQKATCGAAGDQTNNGRATVGSGQERLRREVGTSNRKGRLTKVCASIYRLQAALRSHMKFIPKTAPQWTWIQKTATTLNNEELQQREQETQTNVGSHQTLKQRRRRMCIFYKEINKLCKYIDELSSERRSPAGPGRSIIITKIQHMAPT